MPTPTLDEVIERVKKLRNLAQSTNAHEAALAAARAAELLLQYQIDEASLDAAETQEESDEKVNEGVLEGQSREGGKNRAMWKGTLAWHIAKSLNCGTYWLGNELRVVGRDNDRKAVVYLFMSVSNEVMRLADHCYNVEKPQEHGKTWKASFRMGAVSMIGERLAAQRRVQMEEQKMLAQTGGKSASTALTVIEHRSQAVSTYLKKLKLRKGAPIRARSSDGYQSGREAGAGINLGSNKGALPGRTKELKG